MKDVRTVLLTGNNGYIGTVMTKLLGASYRVVGLDTGWFEEDCLFPVSDEYKPSRQIIKDIRQIEAGDLEGVDAVIHLAALSNDPLGELNPGLTDEINCRSTIRLAELCKKNKVERFIFASSCSIYGKAATDTPIGEDGALGPITAYAKAKVDAENGLAALAGDNFHPVFLRNATVYGVSPRLRLDLVVNNLLAWAYLTDEITIMSDGTPWRPIVHIEDFCSAFMAAMRAPAEKIHCQAFNVGLDRENYRVRDIAEEIKKVLPKAQIKVLNRTGPDERSYRVDFSKIRDTLQDFRPKWNLRKGIDELLEAYRNFNLTLAGFNSDRYFRIRAVKSLLKEGRLDNNLNKTGGKR